MVSQIEVFGVGSHRRGQFACGREGHGSERGSSHPFDKKLNGTIMRA